MIRNDYQIDVKICRYESSCVVVKNNAITPIDYLSESEIELLSLALENATSRLKAHLKHNDGEDKTEDKES